MERLKHVVPRFWHVRDWRPTVALTVLYCIEPIDKPYLTTGERQTLAVRSNAK